MAVVYAGLLIRDIEFPVVLPVTEVQVKGKLNFIDKKEIKVLVKKNISKSPSRRVCACSETLCRHFPAFRR